MKKNKKVIILVVILCVLLILAFVLYNSMVISDGYLYQSNHNKSHVGMKAKKLRGTHRNYKTLLTNKNVFFRHKIEKGVIVSTEIGFKYHNKIYYLKSVDDGDTYQKDIKTLEKAFGKDNCENVDELDSNRGGISCFGEDGYSSAFVTNYGSVGVNIEDDWNCFISGADMGYDGEAYCYREYEDE